MVPGFSGPLEDRLAIRERIGSYSDSIFQCNKAAWLANYADDGIWILNGTEIKGKSALSTQWDLLWGYLEKMMFFTEIGSIEVQGDKARTRSYCREIVCLKNGKSQKVVGLYEDDLIRENGDWLFLRRIYSVLLDEKATG